MSRSTLPLAKTAALMCWLLQNSAWFQKTHEFDRPIGAAPVYLNWN